MEYQALNADKNEIRLLTLYSSHNSNLRPTGAVCCTLENLPLEKNLKRSYNLRSQPDIFSAYWDENVWESSPASSLVTNTLDQHASHPVGPKRYKDCIRGRYSWGEYVALSYTWGDPNKRRGIFVNGKSVQVTEHLESALRVLREKLPMRAGVRLWVDALCINQQDIEERNLQVQRMRDIYKSAAKVVVWLGDEEEDSSKAMQLIKILSFSWKKDKGKELRKILATDPSYSVASYHVSGVPDEPQNGPGRENTRRSRRPQKSQLFGCWHALQSLMLREYWSRVWVFQEICIATKETPVFCGNSTVSFEDLYHAVMDWIDPTISTLIRALMARERLPERYVIKGSLFEVIDWIPRLESVIQNGNLQMVKKYHDVRGRGCWPHPRNVLAEGRQLNATDPRDKIYGFLALIHPAFVKNLKPDYEHTVEQVYIDCSISFMQLDQRLDLLSHCNWTSDQTIPSWVPDWNLKSGPSLLEPGISKGIYCAGGVEIFEVVMEVSADKKKLKVPCLKIDSIDSLSINPVHDEEDAQPTQSATQKNHYGDLKGFKEALGRTFLFNRTSDGTIFRSADKLKALFVIPPPKDARHLTLMEGLFYGFIAANRTLLLAGRPLYKYVLCKEPDGKSDVKWSAPLNSWARNSWEDSLVEIAASNVGNSRLFTTHKGLVGLGPLSSRPEDQVCVLVGCSVPLILRPHENSFKVIGACYTHGLMEGEAFEMLGDGNVKLETIELC